MSFSKIEVFHKSVLKFFLKEEEICEFPENRQDIFRLDMQDCYSNRLNSLFTYGKYAIIDSICYVKFLRCY